MTVPDTQRKNSKAHKDLLQHIHFASPLSVHLIALDIKHSFLLEKIYCRRPITSKDELSPSIDSPKVQMVNPQSDGQKLLESYTSTLHTSTAYFRALLASSSSQSWKKVTLPNGSSSSSPSSSSYSTVASSTSSTIGTGTGAAVGSSAGTSIGGPSSSASGKARSLSEGAVQLHKRSVKGGEVWRAMLEVETGEDDDEGLQAEAFRALLGTAEVRCAWDSMVESANTVEHLDCETRIVRTAYKLGWPSSPRDTITISKTFSDAQTVINISTSLPRSPDEPAYLRPAPPYVRATVSLLAFCVQFPPSKSDTLPLPSGGSTMSGNRVQLTCFWQWNPRGTWAVGSSIGAHLPDLLSNLVDQARGNGGNIPLLTACGKDVSLSSSGFDRGRDTLSIEYAVVHQEDENEIKSVDDKGKDDGTRRTVEFDVPSSQGWRIQISVKSYLAAETDPGLSWEAIIGKPPPALAPTGVNPSSVRPLLLRVTHPPLSDPSQLSRFKVSIARDPSSRTIRINGIPQVVKDLTVKQAGGISGEANKRLSRGFGGDDTASLSGVSLRTMETVDSGLGGSTPFNGVVGNGEKRKGRSEKAERGVAGFIKRSYIYFTSLLQEPEAKWKPILEASQGVSVHQLDSLDPTLVVYRAEAVFVGVGIWDLLAAINSPGARAAWDKTFDDAILLEDVNELSELWWWKSKAAWPVAARDSVVLKTIYKSPTSVHIFSFSTDDRGLFPAIPASESGIIRTQVDLQGWSIEALSPTTTQVTLLEQSDPKGWSNKTSIPQTMATALAGIGSFTIKSGGPPVVTRLSHAKVLNSRFDLEKSVFRVEYQPASWRKSNIVSGLSTLPSESLSEPSEDSNVSSKASFNEPEIGPVPNVECEIRCDFDTWSNSLKLVIDPPPQSVSCLRRHRLSAGGGGGWITIEHDAVVLGEEHVLIIVSKGTSSAKDKNVVTVNGTKIKVDVEELPETEVKLLSKQKRTKPNRTPLDRPPVMGVIRRRRMTGDFEDPNLSTVSIKNPSRVAQTLTAYNPVFSALGNTIPQMATPFSRLWFTPNANSSHVTPPPPSVGTTIPAPPSTHAMQPALEVLDVVRQLYFQRLDPELWTSTTEKDGLVVSKRNVPSLSTAHAVYRASKVFQGSTAEDVSSVVSNGSARPSWDDRFESSVSLESYGNGCSTSFYTSKCAFPFRNRGFFVSTVSAQGEHTGAPSTPIGLGPSTSSSTSTLFLVSASYPQSAASKFAIEKLNPDGLPIGRLLLEGWVMETLDPYGNEQYTIPSTRCTYYSAIDYTGSIPSVVNSSINTSLPKILLSLESYLKAQPCAPLVRFPPAGLKLSNLQSDIATPTSNSNKNERWSLSDVNEENILLNHSLDPIEQEYRLTILIRPQLEEYKRGQSTPRRLPLPDSRAGPSIPRSVSMRLPSPDSPEALLDTISSDSSTIKTIRPVPSLSSMYSSTSLSSTKTIVGSQLKSLSDLTDFVVAEFIVDTGQFPAGYNVTSSAVVGADPVALPPPSTTVTASSDLPIPPPRLPLHPSPNLKKLVLPFRTVIVALPPSILHSASLTPVRPSRKHLVRITLPTTHHLQPPLQDPLRDASKTEPSKPNWLKTLELKGAIVEIGVDRLAGQAYDEPDQILVTVEGSMTQVLGRDAVSGIGSPSASLHVEPDEIRFSQWPKLERLSEPLDAALTPASTDTHLSLPSSLLNPIAVAEDLLPILATALELITDDNPATAPESTEEEDTPTEIGDTATVQSSPATPTLPLRKISNASAPLFNFFGLSRRGGGEVTPTKEHPSQAATLPAIPENLPRPTLPAPSLALRSFKQYSHTAIPATVSFPTMLFIAFISFLLGSLIRSFFTPTDYVVFLDERDREPIAQRFVEESWKEIVRLVEWKGVWWGDDFVLAVVRRS
ncbi:START-like domain [Phaffia rhodozyma]|uniref:START-like domain n=1 Tax=Phaffia rhodozyma TaxID=264483 RepID=A0A0F7SGI4_PHARH|nr:START-like domain [Phaffia rhodozyma]